MCQKVKGSDVSINFFIFPKLNKLKRKNKWIIRFSRLLFAFYELEAYSFIVLVEFSHGWVPVPALQESKLLEWDRPVAYVKIYIMYVFLLILYQLW